MGRFLSVRLLVLLGVLIVFGVFSHPLVLDVLLHWLGLMLFLGYKALVLSLTPCAFSARLLPVDVRFRLHLRRLSLGHSVNREFLQQHHFEGQNKAIVFLVQRGANVPFDVGAVQLGRQSPPRFVSHASVTSAALDGAVQIVEILHFSVVAREEAYISVFVVHQVQDAVAEGPERALGDNLRRLVRLLVVASVSALGLLRDDPAPSHVRRAKRLCVRHWEWRFSGCRARDLVYSRRIRYKKF